MSTRRIYSGKTLETFRQEIIGYIERNIDGVNVDQAIELSRLVIDIMGFAVENMSYGIDNAINEAFFATARFPNSIDQLANTWDYPQQGSSSASGELRIRPSEPPEGDVVLEEGFAFEGDNGFQYITTEETTWQQGARNFKTVRLSEGENRTVTFRGNGTYNQKKKFNSIEGDEFIQFQSIQVLIQNEEWKEQQTLDEESSNHFRVSYIADPPYIEFGDGVVGDIPSNGAEIFVDYTVNHGVEGNIGRPGRITTALDSVTVQNSNIEFEFDETSGVMTGGSNSEDLRSVKAKAPAYHHADKAVVTNDDFDAVANSFQDPVLGTVARAKAFRVDEYEKDLETVSRARTVRKNVIDSIQLGNASISFLQNLLSYFEQFPDNILSDTFSGVSFDDLVSFIESDGGIESFIKTMNDARQDIRELRLEAESILLELESIPNQVTSDANDIDSSVQQIRNELDDVNVLPNAVENSLNFHLDAIEDSSSDIKSSVSSNLIGRRTQKVLSKLDAILSKIDGLFEDRKVLIENPLSNLQRYIDNFVVSLEFEGDRIEQDLLDVVGQNIQDPTFIEFVDRLKNSRDKLDELIDHLGDIYESECGPNLISVPILTFDEDEFYAQPSLGLMNALEDDLNRRGEPSVVIRVSDGSKHLVRPAIDVYFKTESGSSDTDVRDRINSRLLSELKNRAFGQDLYLGGKEGVHEFAKRIEGLDFINFDITGHLPANPPSWLNYASADIEPREGVEIDAQGNLLIPDKNIISRPIDPISGETLIRYFVKKSPTGTPQRI